MIRLSISEQGTPPRLVTFNKDQVMLGRTAECDLCLGGKGVSSRHCRIVRTPAGLQIEDLGSTNGTYVNRQKISGPHPLLPRDEIVVAVYRIHVVDDGQTAMHGLPASPSSFAPAAPAMGPTDYMPAQPAPIVPPTAAGAADMYRARGSGPAMRHPTPGAGGSQPSPMASRGSGPSEPAVDPALAAWQREWEKLDVLSRAWLQSGRHGSQLLTGTKLESARKWLAEGRGRSPAPKREQRDFIFASSRKRQLKIFRNVTIVGLALGAATVAVVMYLRQREPEPSPDDENPIVSDKPDENDVPDKPPPDTRAASDAAAVLAEREEDPVVAALLAIEGVRLLPEVAASRGAKAERVLRQALGKLEGMPLVGHEERINAAVFSPDGKWALTASADLSARLWDLTGEAARRSFALRGHTAGVTALAISSDGKLAFTAGEDGKVLRWTLTHDDPPQTQEALRGLDAGATDAALSGDGQWLVVGARDGSVRVWDASAPAPRSRELSGHAAPIRAVDINYDGTAVLAASEDMYASMWRMAGGNVARRIKFEGHLGAVYDIAISPDGEKILTGGEDGAKLWSPSRSRSPKELLGHDGAVRRVAISADSKLGVTAGADKALRIWELASKTPESGSIAFSGHEEEVLALVLDGPRGSDDKRPNLALSGSGDGTARTWNLDSRATVVTSTPLGPHAGEVRAVAFSPDGHLVLTGDASGAAKIWPHRSPGADGASLVGRKHRDPVIAVALHPAATRMVSASADGTAVVWDLTKPGRLDVVDTLSGHTGAVDAVAVNADGKFAATGDASGTIRLWDLSKPKPGVGHLALAKHKRGVKALQFTPDGKRLVSLSTDAVWVWKLSANPAADAQRLSHEDELVTMSISPDGRWLMTGSVKSVRLWDLDAPAIAKSGKALKKVHALDVAAVGVGPDGKWAVSSGKDATLFLYNLAKGAKAKQLYLHEKQVDAVAFSPDGHWLATGSRDKTVRLWNMRVAHPESESLLLEGHTQSVGVLQFSPDSRWLLSGSNDKTMRVWDLSSEDAKTITSTAVVLEGHQQLVSTARIAREAHMVVSGSYDGTARAWPLVPHALIPIACRAVGRSFTEEEWERFFPGKSIERTCD